MIRGWLRRVIALVPHERRPLAPLKTSAAALTSTRQHHEATLRQADKVARALEDWRRFDGSFVPAKVKKR